MKRSFIMQSYPNWKVQFQMTPHLFPLLTTAWAETNSLDLHVHDLNTLWKQKLSILSYWWIERLLNVFLFFAFQRRRDLEDKWIVCHFFPIIFNIQHAISSFQMWYTATHPEILLYMTFLLMEIIKNNGTYWNAPFYSMFCLIRIIYLPYGWHM